MKSYLLTIKEKCDGFDFETLMVTTSKQIHFTALKVLQNHYECSSKQTGTYEATFAHGIVASIEWKEITDTEYTVLRRFIQEM